ncbi:N-acetylglucosamine-6-sulfatase-like [Cydia amplana]|uniref:N-acetylglucosamine-6-sulfatase-like n=1 Tax=Cydia amplana TaxID=1869771 RepID=UPI002FE5D8FC
MLILNSLLFFLLAGGILCDKPNFVIILTDDQDVTMGGMTPMKHVRRLIGEEGMTFANTFVSSPICCPSRASILTGLHIHNHGTTNNTVRGGCYGPQWKKLEANTFATALQGAGYRTFYAGKYLNEYGKKDRGATVPPGWSEWHGLVGNSVYYNYTLSNNGVPTHSEDLYLTDIIRDISVNFLENQTEPFLMVLAPPAPHQPFTPAPRNRDAFRDVAAPRTPIFNVAAKDKHWLMTMPPSPLPESMLHELDRAYRSRWEALLAVDEMVADVMAMLKKSGRDNTYVIYTSDNGYHVGQFSQVYDKRQPYESDIRVPLLIKGPAIKPNVTSHQPVMNIDLAPTILKLAGLDVPKSMDGRAIDVLDENPVKERTMLVEYFGQGQDGAVDSKCPWKYDSEYLDECRPLYDCKCQDSRNNTYACLRRIGKQVNDKYCEFRDTKDFIEIYDLDADPYEQSNLKNDTMGAFLAWYHHVLNAMVSCKGLDCDPAFVNK